MSAGRGAAGFSQRLFGRRSGRGHGYASAVAPTAPAAPFIPGYGGSAAAPGSAGAWPTATVAASAAAHSFGLGNAAFAPITPPDILDLDAWMDRENWNLGRLSSCPLPGAPTAVKRLDSLIAHEAQLNHMVQAIVVRSGDPFAKWEAIEVDNGYTEIHVPPDAWLTILRHFDSEWQKSGTSSISYKGIPVTIAPF